MKHIFVIVYLLFSGQTPLFQDADCLMPVTDRLCYDRCKQEFVWCWHDEPEWHPETMPQDTSLIFKYPDSEL